MQKGSRYIIFTGTAIGCISSVYFLALLFVVPFIVTVCFILAALYFLYRWVMNDEGQYNDRKFSWWAVALLAMGVFVITNNAIHLSLKHGEWDAWGMWNFHSKYMADPHNWRRMFQNVEFDHVDYPLCLPAFTGFFIRFFNGHFTLIIPFAFSFLITLCIPVLIYTELG